MVKMENRHIMLFGKCGEKTYGKTRLEGEISVKTGFKHEVGERKLDVFGKEILEHLINRRILANNSNNCHGGSVNHCVI
jgi:hypothetical protein